MAHADTLSKLSLDRWARIMGMNSAHFNGVYFGNSPTVCQQPWMQRADQAVDRVGREEVSQAIAQAEADIERALGYRLLPSWEVDEWQPAIHPYRPEFVNYTVTDVRGAAQIARPNWGYMISGGIRSKSLIDDDVAITYTDEDGDTYEETATVTVTVAQGQSPCEVRVFFPDSGGVAEPALAGDDRYEIRPIDVTIAGVTATIRFRREQAVLPSMQSDYFPSADDSHLRGVNGAVDANFLTLVDVFRVYNDPQTQVTFLWEPNGDLCGCGTDGCSLCAYAAQTGCLMIRNERLGAVSYRPGSWNGTTLGFDSEGWAVGREPDIVRLYYYSGLRAKNLACPTTQMDPEWERIVAYYAAALLDRPVCECNNVHAWIDHWRRDFAFSSADEQAAQVPVAALDNPFGTTRGALQAWRRVLREGAALGRGIYA